MHSEAERPLTTTPHDDHEVVIHDPILRMISHIGSESNPRKALSLVLELCLAETLAERGWLYMLDLSNSVYKCHKSIPDQEPSLELPLDSAQPGAGTPDEVLSGVVARRRCWLSMPDAPSSRLVVPIVRKETCLGVMDFAAAGPGQFRVEHRKFVEAASTLAVLLFEKEDTLRLLEVLPTPVDPGFDWEEFLETLILLIAEASTMPVVTLREWDEDAAVLRCLRSFGYKAEARQVMDLSPLERYPQLARAIHEGKTQTVRSVDDPEAAWVKQIPELEGVRSFVVVPVKVGTGVFGTLSFAARCEYDYSEIELAGFETIANAIGVSITNWRSARQASDKLFDKGRISALMTSNEVAQSARHTIINFAGQAELKRILIERALSGTPSKAQIETAQGQLLELKENLNGMVSAVDLIRESARAPDKVWTTDDIYAVWWEAIDMVAGRISHNNIQVHVQGNARAMVCREFLRQAFLQMLFNSIDSLKAGSKTNRKIRVMIEDEGPKSEFIRIRYSDTGAGINPSTLKALIPLPNGRRPEKIADVFLEGVTSKEGKGGSGFGLFEVRKILKHHDSSIDITDNSSSGITFTIRLAKVPKKSRETGRSKELKAHGE
jgi:signal transduction histidine kinase